MTFSDSHMIYRHLFSQFASLKYDYYYCYCRHHYDHQRHHRRLVPRARFIHPTTHNKFNQDLCDCPAYSLPWPTSSEDSEDLAFSIVNSLLCACNELRMKCSPGQHWIFLRIRILPIVYRKQDWCAGLKAVLRNEIINLMVTMVYHTLEKKTWVCGGEV